MALFIYMNNIYLVTQILTTCLHGMYVGGYFIYLGLLQHYVQAAYLVMYVILAEQHLGIRLFVPM